MTDFNTAQERNEEQDGERVDSKIHDEVPSPNAQPDRGRDTQDGFNTQIAQPTAGYQVPLYTSSQPQYSGEAYGGRGQASYAVEGGLPQKTGPSSATICLGMVMLLIGAAMLALGVWFSYIGAVADLRTISALLLAAIGVILLVVAVACVIAQAVMGRKRRKNGNADASANRATQQL